MIFVTGDIHGNPHELIYFCKQQNLTKDDIVIILGDVGVNYSQNERDSYAKLCMSSVLPTFFCIHGNHEIRPQNIKSYISKTFHGGKVLYEKKYPNILFGIDGEIYDFNGKKTIVIGGAYSVDKYYRFYRFLNNSGTKVDDKDIFTSLGRLIDGRGVTKAQQNYLDSFIAKFDENEMCWWSDEQPSEEIKEKVIQSLRKCDNHIDIVLSHTCPNTYTPTEAFLPGISQKNIDKSTEMWLGDIERNISYQAWYCGHWHIDKKIDKVHFLFHTIETL